MLDRTEDIEAIVEDWLGQFERALGPSDDASLKNLFHPDSHWRDILALTWKFTTIDGRDAVLAGIKAHAVRAKPSGLCIDTRRAAPFRVKRAGTQAIEAIFKFETTEG